MPLTCHHCGRNIAAEEIDIQALCAWCSRCGAILDLQTEVPLVTPRPPVPQPASFHVSSTSGALEITWRWATWRTWYALLFCVVWYGLLWLFAYLISGADAIATLFTLPFSLFMIAGLYPVGYAVVTSVNRTTIRVDRWRLTVEHGPLPWSRPITVPTPEVAQLFCEESITRGTLGFTLVALLQSGQRLPLVKTLPQMRQAIFLEQEIEEWLNIEDRPVAGEMHRLEARRG